VGGFHVKGVIFSLFHEHVRKANQQATESLAAKAANDQLETRIRERTSGLLQSNESPQTSELRFRELVEALPAAIYVTDANGRSLLTRRLGFAVAFLSWDMTNGAAPGAIFTVAPAPRPGLHNRGLGQTRQVSGTEVVAERPNGPNCHDAAIPLDLGGLVAR
jgi:hypothetical protein